VCGIFGLIGDEEAIGYGKTKSYIDFLFKASASRGKEAAGLAYKYKDMDLEIFKKPIPADIFIKEGQYKRCFQLSDKPSKSNTIAYIGHSRLVTNGSLEDNDNNQPVSMNNIIGVHNGIVANDEELWKLNSQLKREYVVDTEVLFKLIDFEINSNGKDIPSGVESVFNMIEGNASVAAFINSKKIILATNNGSIYLSINKEKNIFYFASEKFILKFMLEKKKLDKIFNPDEIIQIHPYDLYVIDLESLDIQYHKLNKVKHIKNLDFHSTNVLSKELSRISLLPTEDSKLRKQEEEFDDSFAVDLKRCTRCLLPETFPFIVYDNEGICNYCNIHKAPNLHGADKLEENFVKYRSNNINKPDTLLAISGGRDSIYGLHYLKKVMGMNPIAYTYDWGMVTDIARRNIARITGELGVEHIIVSADIRKKRRYIQKNLKAWLKRPSLGMIPILMAGDKKFKYYGMELQKQNNIDLAVYCAGNRFEKTDFKTGFCNIYEGETKGVLTLSLLNTVKLLSYYGKEYLLNLGYFNESLLDTAQAYYYSYVMPKNYIYLFHYIDWNEKYILNLLENDYGWERADDTAATWRIGDGTASFYNYVYYRVAGFSEFDTFRSNQIREGRMTREEGLEQVLKENRPRFRAIKTYLDLIGMDYEEVMTGVNSIPRLYK